MEMASDASVHFKWMVNGRVGEQHMLWTSMPSIETAIWIPVTTTKTFNTSHMIHVPKVTSGTMRRTNLSKLTVLGMSLKNSHVIQWQNITKRSTNISARARPVTFDVDCQGLLLQCGFWFGCGLGRITVTLLDLSPSWLLLQASATLMARTVGDLLRDMMVGTSGHDCAICSYLHLACEPILIPFESIWYVQRGM